MSLNRMIAGLIALAGLAGGTADAKLYEVTASSLNVRSGPSTSRAVVARLQKRRAINVVENKGDWKRIDWPKKGWVHKKYVRAHLRRYVKADSLNVRRSPSTSAGVVKRLKKGTRVKVVALKGHWRQIAAPARGWVHGKYISTKKPGSGGSGTVRGSFYGTAYKYGRAYRIALTRIDGKAVAAKSAGPFLAMRSAARRAGIYIYVVSGFRTMAEQQYLWRLYGSPRAARPGYSNHQSGTAFDLNASWGNSVYNWLTRNGWRWAFKRTVSFEPWHWEYMR